MGLTIYLTGLLDPGLCQATTSSLWTKLTWRFFHWLTTAPWMLPTALALLASSFVVRRWPRWRWTIRGVGLALLLAYLVLGLPQLTGAAHQALVRALPQTPTPSADAIVVLGRGAGLRSERVALAARFWEAGRAPIIFASGRGDAEPILQSLHHRFGIPATALDGEPCSRTTEENAQLTAAMLQPRGVHSIILITDYPHLTRSYLTFKSLGFQVFPAASTLSPGLSRRHASLLMVREYLGLISYGLLGRYQPRQASTEGLLRHV